AEETGLVAAEADLGPVVATRGGLWRAEDGRRFFSADWFYCVRVSEAVVDTSAQEVFEQSVITGPRWGTIEELTETTELIRPEGLPDLIAQLLDYGVPDIPVQLPWRALVLRLER